MRGRWLGYLRKVHSFLGLFFTPLLLLFVLTGAWQILASEEEREKEGVLHALAEKLSTIHTDSYFPKAGSADPSVLAFNVLAVAMCGALIISVISGMILAWKHTRPKIWAVLALGLGIAVPVAILWLA
jgi:hypothetical protein